MFLYKIISIICCFVLVINFCVFADVSQKNMNYDNIVTEYYSDDIYEDIVSTSVEPQSKNSFDINAKSAVLMEASTGKILFKNQEKSKLPPASITKIMTMLLVVEAINKKQISFYDQVMTTDHAASMGGSQIWLEPGEKMSVHDLLKAVAIGSANDASVALAEHISGSEEAFVLKMNEKAKQLGMKNTNFTNACGLDDENLYTSAEDVAIMSRELIKYDIIKQYTTTWMDTVRNETVQLVNTNKMVRFYKGATGLKTGTTNGAGCCVSATAKRNGIELIAVVMGAQTSNDRFLTARKLLDYGFANYKVFETDKHIKIQKDVQVKRGQKEKVKICYEKLENELLEYQDIKNVIIDYKIKESLEAPILKNQKIGTIKIILNDKVINEYSIKTVEEVKEIDFKYSIIRLLKSLISA